MKRRAFCALTVLILVGCGAESIAPSNPVSGDENPPPIQSQDSITFTVFAHYCNWHVKTRTFNSWRDAKTLPLYSDGECVPGGHQSSCTVGYHSLDAKTIQVQNELLQARNITPLVSWWGRDVPGGDDFLDAYLAVPSSLKIGLLYEVGGPLIANENGLFDFNDPKNVQQFTADMVHLSQKYFQRFPDRFSTIDGKPIIFIWLSHAFIGRFDLAAAAVRQQVPSLYLIGSDFTVTSLFRPGLADVVRGLDAVSAYSIYRPDLTLRFGGQLTTEYADLYQQSLIAWRDWLIKNAPGVKFIAPLSFAFHDNRDNPILRSTPDQARYLSEQAQIQILSESNRCGERILLPMILVVSWNEHFEGTSIEPTEEYGETYMEILHDLFQAPITVPSCR